MEQEKPLSEKDKLLIISAMEVKLIEKSKNPKYNSQNRDTKIKIK